MEKETFIEFTAGNREAFRQIVLEFQRPVFSFALKTLADEDDAKDITQETFIRIWKNHCKYDPERKFITWAMSIASHLCIDCLRHKEKEIPLPEDIDILDSWMKSSRDGHLELSNKEWVSIVRTLAGGLAPKQRIIFTLSCLEDYSNAEITQLTGFNPIQIKSNLYVAKQLIRNKLKQLGYER